MRDGWKEVERYISNASDRKLFKLLLWTIAELITRNAERENWFTSRREAS